MDQDTHRSAAQLLARVEELFADSESIVVAAFEAHKVSHSSESTGAQLLKALGGKAFAREALRSVVLIFTVKRSLADRGFQAALHFARPLLLGQGGTRSSSDDGGGNPRLELRKSYPLKSLHDMRLSSPGRASGRSEAALMGQGAGDAALRRQQVLELRCASHHAQPEHRAQYLLPDGHTAMFFASLAVQLLRHQDAVLPSIAGVTMERLDAWWASHKEEVTAGLSSFALEVVTPGAILVGRSPEDSSAADVLMSAKEAADLTELLASFDMGLGEADAFAAALQEEAAALEAANVAALLGCGPAVEGVLGQLRHTQAVLDDLDQSLQVFDFKLRHMRDDIEAIEASNNSLERQARHNTALSRLLEQLLGGLGVDRNLTAALEAPDLKLDRLAPAVSAAWQLHAKRTWLAGGAPDSLNPLLTQMRVVKEAQARLHQLASRFVGAAVGFITGLVGQLMGEAMEAGARHSDRWSKVSPPDRAKLHGVMLRVRPLLQVLAVLEPRALQQLQQQVSVEVNALLRRELRAAAGELRRGASAELAASGQAGEGDYNLCKEKGGSSSSSAAQPRQRVARLSYGSGGSGPGSDSVSEWPADPTELSSGAAGASAAKRQAFLDGSVPGLPLHEAWSLLLGGFLPFLAAEAAFYADLLLLYRGDEERLRDGPDSAAPDAKQQRQGQASIAVVISRPPGCPLTYAGSQAVEGMLAGLEGDFVALSDLASRSHQVLLLPLLATALAWQQHLAAQPAAAPLAALLESLAGKLRGAWGSFCAGQVAAVEQYDSRSKMGLQQAVEQYDSRSKMGLQQGIKHLHVLPFISQFCLMVHDLEVALVEGAAAAAAVAAAAPSQQQQQQQQQTAGDDGEEGQQSLEQAAAADAARSVRAAADALYDELCPRLLSRLERLASSDAKYGERCRLENHGYLGEALRGLAQKLPALQQHWQVAEARREAALSGYVAEQLAYSKLWKLLEFGDKLDALLKVVSPPEVSFQKDCSPAEVRSLMRSTMDGTDKKLEALAGRVRKHLGGGALFNVAWAAVKEALLARYEHLEWLLEQCYPTTPLRPSPEELRELFRATSAG
ncbi:hypothetical protein OEZ86_009092 [Tetradesmus obliquus]|nr:hypothetical protein OEZ86_009092 [Tetradesmus obliquus]